MRGKEKEGEGSEEVERKGKEIGKMCVCASPLRPWIIDGVLLI